MEANKDFYQVRLMTHEDIDKCLILWRSHDFFEDKQTVVCAMKLNPEGFFVAEHKETGKLRFDDEKKGFYYKGKLKLYS